MGWLRRDTGNGSRLDPRTLVLGPSDLPPGFDLVNETIEGVVCNRHYMKAVPMGYSPAMSLTVAVAKDISTAHAGFAAYVAIRRQPPMWRETRRLVIAQGDEAFGHQGVGVAAHITDLGIAGRPSTWAGARFGRAVASVFTDGIDDETSLQLVNLQFGKVVRAMSGT